LSSVSKYGQIIDILNQRTKGVERRTNMETQRLNIKVQSLSVKDKRLNHESTTISL